MCLYLKQSDAVLRYHIKPIKHSYKTETINGEQLIPVWKSIKRGTNQSPARSSSVKRHNWIKGWNRSTRTNTTKTVNEEYDKGAIACGFHFSFTKKEAEQYRSEMYTDRCDCQITKMYVRKRDIVAKGIHGVFVFGELHMYVRGLVATKAYWKG